MAHNLHPEPDLRKIHFLAEKSFLLVALGQGGQTLAKRGPGAEAWASLASWGAKAPAPLPEGDKPETSNYPHYHLGHEPVEVGDRLIVGLQLPLFQFGYDRYRVQTDLHHVS